jgi:hypothetical protein
MIKRTGSLVTLCGLIGNLGFALVGIPVAIIVAYAQVVKDGPPHWFNVSVFPCIALGVAMKVIAGTIGAWASKGADDHSTIAQTEAATTKAVADHIVTATEAVPSEMPAVPVVIVKPPEGK